MRTYWLLGVGVIVMFSLVTHPDVVLLVLVVALFIGWQLRKRGVIR